MATPNQMNNLTTLLKRLEAATCRLEDIASAAEIPKDASGPVKSSAAAREKKAAPLAAPKRLSVSLPESIEEFDVLVNTAVDKYVRLSNEIGGLVAQQAAEVFRGFQEQRKFLLIATKASKPEALGYDLLKPINEAMIAASDLKEANRPHPLYTHLASVADGIMMLGWVTIDHRPHTYVEDALGSAQFFGNRVLKEYKDNDPKHAEWIQAFYRIFTDLAAYVKAHHPDGVTWNPKGEPVEEVAKSISSTPDQGDSPVAVSSGSSGAPPPPPPPGPAPVLDIKTEPEAASSSSSLGGFNAVFSELNRGESVTQGLRKVDKQEMTHKNPALRAGSTVSDELSRKTPAPGKKPKPESMRVKKSAKKELEGQKWTVENYEKEPQPVEIEASLSHSVLISRCNNTTIIIKGKANQITVENSTRLSLVVDTLVSTVDVVKANNFALQVLGTVPAVMLDQIDSAQIYFSKESSGTKIFSSKCAGINLNIISGPEDDYKEVPLPSQICSYYDVAKGDLVNEIVAHTG